MDEELVMEIMVEELNPLSSYKVDTGNVYMVGECVRWRCRDDIEMPILFHVHHHIKS